MSLIGRVNLDEVNYFDLGFSMIKSPFLISGFACYGLSLLAWMIALSRVEVSFAYPFLSIGYIITLFFGYYLFHESINSWKIFGMIFILFGVMMIAKGGTS